MPQEFTAVLLRVRTISFDIYEPKVTPTCRSGVRQKVLGIYARQELLQLFVFGEVERLELA